MAVKATPAARAPRGTKTLTQAFFSAAEGIPEDQREAVVKAALAAIRDQLKDARERARLAKAKARQKAASGTKPGRPAAAGTRGATASVRPRGRTAARPAAEGTDDAGTD
jgi:TRAP-type C4-dicarboxylate transport system substrate-binding protein